MIKILAFNLRFLMQSVIAVKCAVIRESQALNLSY